MRLIFSIIALFLSSCASNNYKEAPSSSLTVRVIGIGSTFESAQENGLRNAVQQVFGAIVISERELSNDNLSENNLSYSKGMIENFNVSNFHINPKDKQFNLQMTVSVSPTAMGKRILYSSDSAKVDGNNISEKIRAGKIQVASEYSRFNQAKSLFNHIAFELPLAIFDTKVKGTSVKRNGADIFTEIDISLTPNEGVIKSLCSVGQNYNFSMLEHLRPLGNNGTNHWLQVACGGTRNSDTFMMSSKDWNSLKHAFDVTRVCLSILDNSNIELSKILVDLSLWQRGYTGEYANVGVNEYYGSLQGIEYGGVLRYSIPFQEVLKISRKASWADNSINIRTNLPKNLESISNRIATIQARVVSKNMCNTPGSFTSPGIFVYEKSWYQK